MVKEASYKCKNKKGELCPHYHHSKESALRCGEMSMGWGKCTAVRVQSVAYDMQKRKRACRRTKRRFDKMNRIMTWKDRYDN